MNDMNEYLYIGRTRDIHQRISQHKGTKHWFSEVKEVWCQEIFTDQYLEVNDHERTLIDFFKPKYNKTAHKQPRLETPPIYKCEFIEAKHSIVRILEGEENADVYWNYN
jgi:excinuclease UvrABC nuclease subunit